MCLCFRLQSLSPRRNVASLCFSHMFIAIVQTPFPRCYLDFMNLSRRVEAEEWFKLHRLLWWRPVIINFKLVFLSSFCPKNNNQRTSFKFSHFYSALFILFTSGICMRKRNELQLSEFSNMKLSWKIMSI